MKTIGLTSRDFSTMVAYASYLNALTLSAPEVANVYKDSGPVADTAVVTLSGWAGGSSVNTVTIQAAAGQGFQDDAGVQTNALRWNSANGAALSNSYPYNTSYVIGANVIIKGLQIRSTAAGNTATISIGGSSVVRQCILESNNSGSSSFVVQSGGTGCSLENTLVHARGTGSGMMSSHDSISLIDVTMVSTGGGSQGIKQAYAVGVPPLAKNTVVFGFTSSFQNTSNAASTNNATSLSAFDGTGWGTAGQVSVASGDFVNTTGGAADFRIASGSTKLKNLGVAAGPTVDIVGTTRPQGGSYDIGSWEYVTVDTTAPVLTSPTGAASSSTTATGSVTTDEGAGTLYRMASTNATESAATIKAAALTTSVTATGAQSVTFTGLTASTTYYNHYVQDDAAGTPNVSNVVHSASYATPAPDTTAPNLSSPTGTTTGTTTASGTVTTDESNGTLYSLATTNATETAATVKASGAQQTITTTGSKSVSATGLTPTTVYYYHYVHRDAAGNDSARVTSASFTTNTSGDTTPPTLSSPTGTQTGSTTASGTVSTNEANGLLYRMASTNATESVATIKAAALSQAVTATGVQNVTFTGLSPSTLYYAHYAHTDAANNDSTAANSASFTTPASPNATFTYSATVKNVQGGIRAGIAHSCTIHDKTTRALLATKTGLTSDPTTGAVVFTLPVAGSIAVGTEYLIMPITTGNIHDTGFMFVTTT